MTALATQTPAEIDSALADFYYEAQALRERIATLVYSAKQQAGATFYYRGRRRVTDMTADEAEEVLATELAKLAVHRAANQGRENLWVGYAGIVPPHAEGSATRTVEKLAEARAQLAEVDAKMAPLEAVFGARRWSRFFLVTSSQGHIHSSMNCSTCRLATTYGWLPQLSGRTETEAVAEHGPALCSVCFPSAPVEWTAEKISKRRAEEAAR